MICPNPPLPPRQAAAACCIAAALRRSPLGLQPSAFSQEEEQERHRLHCSCLDLWLLRFSSRRTCARCANGIAHARRLDACVHRAPEGPGGGAEEMSIPLAIFLVFLGCCSNVVFLELIVKLATSTHNVKIDVCCKRREDNGAGNTITFFQFLFISMEGLVFVSQFFTISPTIPIRLHITDTHRVSSTGGIGMKLHLTPR